MTSFEVFYNQLIELCSKYEKSHVPLKIERDLDNQIIKIFGENISSLERAKNGLNDISELGYATAEHHPFWNVLYSSAEILHIILEKWNEDLSKTDIDDIKWSIDSLNQHLEKLKLDP